MAKQRNAEKFWMWFLFHQQVFLTFDHLTMDKQDAWIDEIQRQLDKYRKGLFFSLNLINGFHGELTISANGRIALLEDVALLVQSAPVIPNWKFNCFIRREELDNMVTYFDTVLFPDDIYFTARKGKKGMRLFNVRLYIRHLSQIDRNDLKHAAAYMLLTLLGEVHYMVGIGAISFAELPEDSEGLRLHTLRELPDYVSSQGTMRTLLTALFAAELSDGH